MNQTLACRPLYIGHNNVGDRFDKNGLFVFFGNRAFTESEMDRCFPHMRRSQLKQTHSNLVHRTDHSSLGERVGDAQVSSEIGIALSVYTADCLPILIFDPIEKQTAAIHAGWRGVENRIVSATIEALKLRKPEQALVWVGPHIQKESFEVGVDVGERLQAVSNRHDVLAPHPTLETKRFVDLSKIVLNQMTDLGVHAENVWFHAKDTYLSEEFYSFRRDGKGGRLISFICRLE